MGAGAAPGVSTATGGAEAGAAGAGTASGVAGTTSDARMVVAAAGGGVAGPIYSIV